jgi:hypothetical protein
LITKRLERSHLGALLGISGGKLIGERLEECVIGNAVKKLTSALNRFEKSKKYGMTIRRRVFISIFFFATWFREVHAP